jgi:hypothetical protein
MASLALVLIISIDPTPTCRHNIRYTHRLVATQTQRLVKMLGHSAWLQAKRYDEKAERRRVLDKEKADRQKAREERHRAADLRRSQGHEQRSHQQTIHSSYSYIADSINAHGSHTETRHIKDGPGMATVETITNTYTITSPDGSLPYRDPRPEPKHVSAYTGQTLYSPTYYPEQLQPLGKEHRDTHGYQSTGSKTPSKPRYPSQQAWESHHERGRRGGKASVIQPDCISEPETEIAAPAPLPKDVVKMLPTPPPSVTDRPPRASSPSKRPATNARQTESGSSWQYHGRPATQSSNAPFIPPPIRSARTNDGSHIPLTKEEMRRSATTLPSTPSRPASRPTDRRPHRRGGLPSIFDQAPDSRAAWYIYDNTTASEFHRNREAPIPSRSEREPIPSKTPSTAKTTEGADTEKAAAKAERPAETTAGTRKKRGPRLGASSGRDLRDGY